MRCAPFYMTILGFEWAFLFLVLVLKHFSYMGVGSGRVLWVGVYGVLG